MIDKNTIYSYFQTDDFPTEEQFRATWDSFWHKSESIPMSQISGLAAAFANTITIQQLTGKANVDASNITNSQSWRDTLSLYSKSETDNKVENLSLQIATERNSNNNQDSIIQILESSIDELQSWKSQLTDADTDNIVNTLSELLATFQDVPEGTDIYALINSKINTSDIVNNLTSLSTTKVLSANQGKVLKDLIDTLTTSVTSMSLQKVVDVGSEAVNLNNKKFKLAVYNTDATSFNSTLTIDGDIIELTNNGGTLKISEAEGFYGFFGNGYFEFMDEFKIGTLNYYGMGKTALLAKSDGAIEFPDATIPFIEQNESNKIAVTREYVTNKLSEKLDSGTYVGNANDLNKKIDDIQIGGRNLLLNSTFKNGMSSWITNNNISLNFVNSSLELNLPSGEGKGIFQSMDFKGYSGYITISFEIKSPVQNLVFGIENKVLKEISLINDNSSFHRYEQTFYVNSATVHSILFYFKGSEAIVTVRNLKLEKGNKATDWTPAIEDQNSVMVEESNTFGRFIDGTEIFKKSFTSENSSDVIDIRDLNIKDVVKIDGIFTHDDMMNVFVLKMPCYDLESATSARIARCWISDDNGYLNFSVKSCNPSNLSAGFTDIYGKVLITVEYTRKVV